VAAAGSDYEEELMKLKELIRHLRANVANFFVKEVVSQNEERQIHILARRRVLFGLSQ
jgi:hypothetical protein